MDTVKISVQERSIKGKSALRSLKNQGMIPGVLYNNHQSIPIILSEDQMKNVLNKHGEDVLLSVNFNGDFISARIQEVQRDPVHKDIIRHIDLMPLDNKGRVLH